MSFGLHNTVVIRSISETIMVVMNGAILGMVQHLDIRIRIRDGISTNDC